MRQDLFWWWNIFNADILNAIPMAFFNDPSPVRAPWISTETHIHERFGARSLPNSILLYSFSSINDDEVAKETDFESETQIRDYYIGLFHELRHYAAKKNSRKSKMPEWQALCQSWNAFVENFNKDPKAYRERVAATRDRYYTYISRGKCERLHDQSMKAGIPCAVPIGTFCLCCPPGASRLSKRDLTGHTFTRVPDHMMEPRARLEPLEDTSAVSDRSTPRTGFNPASYGGLRTPSPIRNVFHQDVSRLLRISLGGNSLQRIRIRTY
ncbi:hypothetical protein P3T76_013460 [Phytophthora citrophthora]|uniref:Uncharacterized protein n=1 Tax=Phytophthora citrophthora TaxID=4793 RepID=A0AAD9G3V6_9STRA|nr:hypothetical protein P3T76_013460 [Phytophthora citrophthora]